MSEEIVVILSIVVPDGPPPISERLAGLLGRSLPQVPGSWVTRIAVTELPAAQRSALFDGELAEPGGLGMLDGSALSRDELDAELAQDFGVETSCD